MAMTRAIFRGDFLAVRAAMTAFCARVRPVSVSVKCRGVVCTGHVHYR
jgi:hypothetical protein